MKSKFRSKKEPNPVKVALKSLEDYLQVMQYIVIILYYNLQTKHSTEYVVGSRLALGDTGRTSPVLFHRRSTVRSTVSETSSSASSKQQFSFVEIRNFSLHKSCVCVCVVNHFHFKQHESFFFHFQFFFYCKVTKIN